MKIVLLHKVTGRYYSPPGGWVRRADNALTFDDLGSARAFSRVYHLEHAQPVHRLAPYIMALLQRSLPIANDDPGANLLRGIAPHNLNRLGQAGANL